MTFCSDLSRLIKGQFDKNGISYDRSMPLDRLAARYFEMKVRRIQPVPRQVHFSDQIHDSLGDLSRQGRDNTSAQDAWGTVFRLRQRLVDGCNVNEFLSKNIRRVTGRDGLLWEYGMHHFHLGRETRMDGFVTRSDYLLFAIVAPWDVYFVDVRPHPPKDGVEWVSQELLHIVHWNWPKLIEAKTLHGVSGAKLTDEQMHQLRKKNASCVIDIEGKAVAPLLMGMASDGSSVLCTFWAMRLMKDLQNHEEILRNDEICQLIRRNLRAQGFDAVPIPEFEIVILEESSLPSELLDALTAENCFSKDLSEMGFAVREKRTGSIIVLQDNRPSPT